MKTKLHPSQFGYGLALFFLMAIFAVVMGLGTHNLGKPSIWLDEATTAFFAKQESHAQVIQTVLENKPYPPLYYLAVHESLKFSDDEFGLRLPSVLSGALLVVFSFLLGRALFGNTAGFFAALFTLLSPKIFFQMRDGTSYAMYAAFTTASTYFLWQAWSKRHLLDWAAFILTSLLSLATHFFSVFFLAAQVISVLSMAEIWRLFRPRSPSTDLKNRLAELRPFAVSLLLIVIPLLWGMTYYLAHSGDTGKSIPENILTLATLNSLAANYGSYAITDQMKTLQCLGLLSCFLICRKKFIFLALILGIYLVTTVLFLQYANPSGATKFVLNIGPILYLFAGTAFRLPSLLASRLKAGKFTRPLALGIVLLLSFQHLTFAARAVRLRWQQTGFEGWKSMAKILEEHGNPADVIFISAGFMQKPLDYYYEGPIPRIGISREEIGKPSLDAFILKHAIGKQRLWLILSHLNNAEALEQQFNDFSVTLPQIENRPTSLKTVKYTQGYLPSIKFLLYSFVAEKTERETPPAPTPSEPSSTGPESYLSG